MATGFTEGPKQKLAGELSEAEQRFRATLQESIRAGLQGRWSFQAELVFLWADLDKIRRFNFDVDEATASGSSVPSSQMPSKVEGEVPALSASERAFLEDADGLISWVVRNGVSFPAVLAILGHDVFEIQRHDFSLEKALADWFKPKVSGWAKRNSEPIGESIEQG